MLAALDPFEVAARRFERGTHDPRWTTPGDIAAFLTRNQTKHRTRQTPALELIDQALVDLADTPDGRLIITMPPQEGKSTRVARDFPIWWLIRDPDARIVIASYGERLASRNGRLIRKALVTNPELGLRLAEDNGAVGQWSLEGSDGGVMSVGIQGGVTGWACDLLIIDDPIKNRQQADSKLFRDRVWDWWTDEASARFGADTKVVLILTRWHHDDLAGRLLKEPDSNWRIVNIPAECVDPHTDPLQRKRAGEFMISARGRTPAQWATRKRTVGSRTWASQYQGNPTPDSGNLFPSDGWKRYTLPLWLNRDDGTRIVPDAHRDPNVELIQSWDFTFKALDSSDYVVGQIWLRRGPSMFLLDQVRRRMSFTESCQAMLDLTARWPQATLKLVEDKANGTAVLDTLRAKVGGLIPVTPTESKYARAVAITPLSEAGNIVLPDPIELPECAWVVDLVEEARDFPNAPNDDTVDCMSQAGHRLLLVPIAAGEQDAIEDDLTADWMHDVLY